MRTGGCPQFHYCWALPATWGSPCYRRFRSPSLTREPFRSWRLYVVRASIAADGIRENDDAYHQFANMLGEDTYSDLQTADTSSSAHADFADSLGLDGNDREDSAKKKSVPTLSPKKVVIDPEDYNIFDEMLERTGGRGRKPVKGAKQFSRYFAKKPRIDSNQQNEKSGAEQTNIESGKPKEDAGPETAAGFFLTEEERAQAYAVMMEEFGPCSHDDVETWTPDDDVGEPEPQPLQLMTPPERPGVPRPVEPATQSTSQPELDAGGQQIVQLDTEDFPLLPKPSWQSLDGASPPQETVQNAESESEKNATYQASSEAPVARISPQLDRETPLHEEHLRGHEEQETQTIKTELKTRPTWPMLSSFLSERSQMPVEGRTPKTFFPSKSEVDLTSETTRVSRDIQTSEQVTPSVLEKPQRQQESLVAKTVEDDCLKLNTGFNRQFGRKEKVRNDEPPKVLKDPKLVYPNE